MTRLPCLFLALLFSAQAGGADEIKDPIGDLAFSPMGHSSPDLRAASARVTAAGHLTLSARFAPGTFDRATTFIQFSLLLGPQSGDKACIRCGNYLVDINGIGSPPRKAELKRLAGDDGKYQTVQSVPIQYRADGVDISLPSALFASPLAEVTYRVVTAVKLDAEATSIILDALPDDSMATATRGIR